MVPLQTGVSRQPKGHCLQSLLWLAVFHFEKHLLYGQFMSWKKKHQRSVVSSWYDIGWCFPSRGHFYYLGTITLTVTTLTVTIFCYWYAVKALHNWIYKSCNFAYLDIHRLQFACMYIYLLRYCHFKLVQNYHRIYILCVFIVL